MILQYSASRSSRPSRGSTDRTSCSCWTRTPDLLCSPCGRHSCRHHQARHSHPHPRHKGHQECSTSYRYNSSQHISDLVSALEEHFQTRMSWTRWLSARHWARRSSRPSRDSRDRTCGSCYSRTPGPADTRSDHHCPRHPRARHSHPRHSHRGPQGCSTAARYSYDQRISDLLVAGVVDFLVVLMVY